MCHEEKDKGRRSQSSSSRTKFADSGRAVLERIVLELAGKRLNYESRRKEG